MSHDPQARPCRRARTTARAIRVVAFAAIAAVAAVLTPFAGAAPAPITWTAPIPIDAHPLKALSCPSTSLCVAADGSGSVLTSTHPLDPSASWTMSSVPGAAGFTALTCPTTTFCAGVDGTGLHVVTSTDPTGGSAAWTTTSLTSAHFGLNEIACASAARCALSDAAGYVYTSTDPAGGVPAWHSAYTPGDHPSALTCVVATTFCLFAGGSTFATSTDSTPGSAWNLSTFTIPGFGFESFACPTTQFCLGGDTGGGIGYSTTPSVAASWNVFPIDDNGFMTAASCASEHFCIVGQDYDDLSSSADPTGGSAAWSTQRIGSTDYDLMGAACLTDRDCIAVDTGGNLFLGRTRPALTLEPPQATQTTAAVTVTARPNSWTLIFCDFEYSTDSSFSNAGSTFCDPNDPNVAPSGFATVHPTATLTDLQPSTTYNYRFALTYDNDGIPPGLTMTSETGTFTTAANLGGGTQAPSPTPTTTTTATAPPINDGGIPAHHATAAEIAPGPAALRKALITALGTSGKAAKIGALIKAGFYRTTFLAPGSGTLTITWSTPHRSSRSSVTRTPLLARATAAAPASGPVKVKVKLTAAGRRALRHARRLSINATATFTSTGGTTTSTTKSLSLTR
jgi:hypothetical protein